MPRLGRNNPTENKGASRILAPLFSLFKLMRLDLPDPNYTTLSHRAAVLVVRPPTQVRGSLHLGLDSTGLKTYGQSEWLQGPFRRLYRLFPQ